MHVLHVCPEINVALSILVCSKINIAFLDKESIVMQFTVVQTSEALRHLLWDKASDSIIHNLYLHPNRRYRNQVRKLIIIIH